MPIVIKNTRELLSSSQYKQKVLIYGPGGVGKSEWASGAPNPGFCAGETGHGGGLLTIADKGHDFFQPTNYADLEQFCSGHVFPNKDTLVLDGMSYLTDTIIKDYALSVPRREGNSKKREMGVPELDDYQMMAELERRLLAKLLSQPKHIIVTCLMDYYQPAEGGERPRAEKIGGPDLPGQMRLGSTAMFDMVLRLWTRSAIKDPKDAKSRYIQRFFLTENDGKYLAKCRVKNGRGQLLPTEVVYDLQTQEGSFNWILEKALRANAEKEASGVAASGSNSTSNSHPVLLAQPAAT